MTRTPILICALSLWASSVSAAQFSIECAWFESYHMTFDTDAKRVIFESPGYTRLRGQITRSTNGQLEFELLRVAQPKFDLMWNTQNTKLTWMGVRPDGTPEIVIHDCVEVKLRPALSKYDEIPPRG